MTVTYTAQVATCKGFGCFLKLLFRWQGSIYKLVWPDLFLFLGTFFSLNVLYRFFLTLEQQKSFAKICIYCEKYGSLIPLSFVLGFYVSIVVERWWAQYKSIPWPDATALLVSASIHGQDEKGRLMRRTIMRYCCLSATITFTLISPRVKKRFPTLNHLIEAGLLTENEKDIIDDLNRAVPLYSKQWVPLVWATSIVTKARKEGKIRDDIAVKTILDEINNFRSSCGLLISYDWISVPLVYTQVVTLAVYSYFLSCVMGRQWIDPVHLDDKTKTDQVDLYFPIFTTLQFFFYMGWLKVAESLLNPFGDDDDDYELNWMVDRNLQVSYLIVDEMHHEHPELIKDQYWDEVFPSELPYTVASEQYRDEPPAHSTDKIQISKANSEIVSPPSVKLDELNDNSVVRFFRVKPNISLPIIRSHNVDIGPRISTPQNRRSGSFTKRERTHSIRSNSSQSTMGDAVTDRSSRTGSISSIFKRMFSREKDSNLDGKSEVNLSSVNIPRSVVDDIIPELDENLLTLSAIKPDPNKPTVKDIFGDKLLEPTSSGAIKEISLGRTSQFINIPGTQARNSKEPSIEMETRQTDELHSSIQQNQAQSAPAQLYSPSSTSSPSFPSTAGYKDLKILSVDSTPTSTWNSGLDESFATTISFLSPSTINKSGGDDDDDDKNYTSKPHSPHDEAFVSPLSESISKRTGKVSSKLIKAIGLGERNTQDEENADRHLLEQEQFSEPEVHDIGV